MNEVRVRHGRTAIGVPLAALSLAVGIAGMSSSSTRSGAVETAFSATWAIAWYAVMTFGSALLCLAITQPWPARLETRRIARCLMNRLYLERGGLFVVGWLWTSYSAAAFAIQGPGGMTAAGLALIIGIYTGVRIRQQFIDMPALKEWMDAQDKPVPAVA